MSGPCGRLPRTRRVVPDPRTRLATNFRRNPVGEFADELTGGLQEARDRLDQARQDKDAYGTEVWQARLDSLERLAEEHGIPLPDRT
jgi:hypothetical protein